MKQSLSLIPENESDWHKFMDNYKHELENSIRFQGVPESDIDDLLQESFLAIWKAFKRNMYNKDKSGLRTWVNRITKNKSIDFLRRESAKLNKISKLEKEIDQNIVSHNKSPNIKSLLRKANFSTEDQNLITDYFCGDLSNKNLSQKYNISLSATEKRISRLKSKLRKVYRLNYVYSLNS